MQLLVLAFLPLAVLAHNGLPPKEFFDATSAEEFFKFAQSAEDTNGPDERHLIADSTPLLAASFGGTAGFYHGVASGDPLPDAVIVWTRYTPVQATDKIDIELRMAKVGTSNNPAKYLDPAMNPALKRARITVTAANDWIAKIDVTGLEPLTNYVFAFTDGVTTSLVGQAKTAPKANGLVASLTYAVFSCSHFANGYFHAYDIGSTIQDLDFWIHLGDYYYEYGKYSSYASNSPERKVMIMPDHEPITVQDYRLRHASYLLDEGLVNLRRRAPMIAVWDDHETTNNSYGQGAENNTGAENHQQFCTANPSSTNQEKEKAGCDRDEGLASVRFTAAAQAYMEWMPIRKGPGTMGVITTTSITQIIEWGNLATVVAVDSRISYRSGEPALRSSFFGPFAPISYPNTNISSYTDPSSSVFVAFKNVTAGVNKIINDPKYTMIGKYLGLLKNTFQASKKAGKPWQIWAQQTMLGPNKGLNLARCSEVIATPEIAAAVQGFCSAVLTASSGGFFRSMAAMDFFDVAWNSDDFNGYGFERSLILDMVQKNANNAIILGGDLHDSWAWQLYDKGAMSGKPVAVNLGGPGVTSPGWGPLLGPLFNSNTAVKTALGGSDGVYKFLNDMLELQNEGLVFADIEKKGFFAVKATKTTHTAEYFLVNQTTTVTNFQTARTASGKITAAFTCDASLLTNAANPGELTQQSGCSAIQFQNTRPVVWTNVPVPISPVVARPALKNCGMDGCKSKLSTKSRERE